MKLLDLNKKSKNQNFIQKLTSNFDIEKNSRSQRNSIELNSSKKITTINGNISFAKFSQKKESNKDQNNLFKHFDTSRNESINPSNLESHSENNLKITSLNNNKLENNLKNEYSNQGIFKKF